MNYKNLLSIIIFLLFTNCSVNNSLLSQKSTKIKKGFSNKGFALIFNQKDYENKLVSRNIDSRSMIIFQRNLKVNSRVKITNLINNKYLIASVGKKAVYPSFNNSVITRRIADELDLDTKEPYIEILEIEPNSMFVAKKAKTFNEERNVAKKAPVNIIDINDLNFTKVKNKKKLKRNFSYKIKIADFYFKNSANLMVSRIIDDTEVRNPKIEKVNNENYRVYLGPFNNIISLQKSYNDISILEFENIEIIKND
tara:strand:- start:1218 stop:1976 length:759 start_codon:yes stop_codon:yes gene_type:complete